MERWTGSAPPACGESSAGSRSRRKAPAGRPTRPAIRLSGGGHWRGRIGPAGGVDGHGRRYRIFCMSTCKVSGLAFVHAWEDRTAHRTAHRAGDEGPIATLHPAPASAGPGWAAPPLRRRLQRHSADGAHASSVSAERRGEGTIQPAWAWRAAYLSGRSKPLGATGSWSGVEPAGWPGRRPTSPIVPTRSFPATVCTSVNDARLLPDKRLRTGEAQAFVLGRPRGHCGDSRCSPRHAAPSEAARYFWWRRRRWFARGVRGCAPGALASPPYERRVRRTYHRPVRAGPTAGPVGRRSTAKQQTPRSFDSKG